MIDREGRIVEQTGHVRQTAVQARDEQIPAPYKPPGILGTASGQGVLQTLRVVMHVRLAKFATLILLSTILTAVFAPWVAPYDPIKAKPWDSLEAPSNKYWLGADRLGRDQLSRLIYGARVSLVIGIGGVGMSLILGICIGVTAGWYGHTRDEVLMRLMDGLAAFPGLLLALALVAITGGAVLNIILVVGLVGTPLMARVIRSQVLSVREREFVTAVVGLGANPGRIMLKHVLPNCLAPVIVQATLRIGAAILLEASLSFLGVGVMPPTPTWGGMLRHAFETVELAPWLTISPGIAIFLVVLAFNFFGDALRDVLDPMLKGSQQ
jgi:peptide/nickel transport system permease protein